MEPKPEFEREVYQPGVRFKVWQAETVSPQMKLPQGRKITTATVLLPFCFVLLHLFVLNMVAMGLLLFEILKGSVDPANPMSDLMKLSAEKDIQNIASIVMAAICIPLYLFVLRYMRKRAHEIQVRQSLSVGKIAYALLAAVAALGVVSLYMEALLKISEHSSFIAAKLEEYNELSNLIVSADFNFVTTLIATVILVPIAEELLFRGIVLGELLKAMPEGVAVLISALAFAFFHMNFIQSSYVFVPGIVLGLAFVRSKNLLVPILMHILFNFLGGFLPMWMGMESRGTQILSYVELGLLGVFVLVSLILWRQKRIQHEG